MYKPALATLCLLLVLGLFFAVNAWLNSDQVINLDAVEVKNYQGQDLSSVNDFRENSIKGPQQVGINNYKLEVTGLVKNRRNYTYDQIIKKHINYQKVVTLDCVEGWSVTILWKGILVSDLIKKCNQPQMLK